MSAGEASVEEPSTASDAVASSGRDGPPSSVEEIVAVVDRAAEGLGETDPTDIEWVSSTRSAANLLIAESVVAAGEEDVDVLVIQARGDFTVPGTSGPPDPETGRTAPAATGEVLNVILDASTGQLLDYGVHHVPANLAELGEVETAPAA